MNRSRLIFFFVVLGVVLGIARCNSRSTSSTTAARPVTPEPRHAHSNLLIPPSKASPVVTPAPTAALAQIGTTAEFKAAAEKITPAVIALAVFDASGRLLHKGTGFFVSDDGRFVTSRSIVDGGTNAVAKTSDGQIYNVSGILAESAASDLSVLKAQVKGKVPFLTLNKTAPFEAHDRLAAIRSPIRQNENVVTETTIAERKANAGSEWLELTAPLPGDSLGAPVINRRGEPLGLVALQRGQGPAINVVRLANALDPIFAQITSRIKPAWASRSEEAAAPPAEGPSPKPKVPLARGSQTGRLIYSPSPSYPVQARHSYLPARGTGRYKVRFGPDGSVRDVGVVQSSRNGILDSAALDALRKWKAAPGQEWTANVPITFQP